jgi:hypothetical protein
MAMRSAQTLLSSFVDRIAVNEDNSCRFDRKDVLKHYVTAGATGTSGVRTLIPKWRTVQDKSANTYVIEVAVKIIRQSSS